MKTVVAYTGLQAIGATLVGLTAVADGSVPITNGHILLPKPMQLDYLYAMGTGISNVQMSSPSLRYPNLPDIYPVDTVAQPASDPIISDYREHPFNLPALEEIVIATTNTNAAAQQHTVLLFLGEPTQPWDNRAPIFSVRATAAITAVALKWTSGLLTFTQALGSGTYAVLGMWAQSATLLAARLIFPLNTNYRPGIVGSSAYGQRGPFQGRKAPHGVLGTFVNTAPPQLEILCTAADAAQVLIMDIAKVA